MLKIIKPDAINSEGAKKGKPTSQKKIDANRANSKKSPGPRNTKYTKNNALKHGLRAAGVSMLDCNPECQKLIQAVMEEMNPTGPLQTTLAEAMAAELIRIKRANEMEADDIDASIEFPPAPPFYPGIMRPRLAAADAERLIRLHQRYRTASLNAFLRISHDIERRQRMRSVEVVQAPNVLDVNLKGTQ